MAITATGGTITTDGNFKVHTFTGNGTFQVTGGSGKARVLVVAGGGGGNGGVNTVNFGSAGGGGTVQYNGAYSISVNSYGVTVGARGNGVIGNGSTGGTGGNSVFNDITATGGTGVAANNQTGGANANYAGGYQGGNSGGGGAGGGAAGSGKNGGAGYSSDISGSTQYYAGGGGGGFDGVGANGGGNGANGRGTDATYYGAGGGGGKYGDSDGGGHGYQGIVIIRYSYIDPAVTTGSASSVDKTTATLAGNVTDAGGGTVSERGVCWSTGPNPTTASPKANSGTGTGSYTVPATGLTASTLYHYRAYVINENSTQYGADQTFTTLPDITTDSIQKVASTTAEGTGTISGGTEITERGFCFSINSTPTISDSKATSAGTNGTFLVTMPNLLPGIKYYARAYATNATGTTYGSELWFRTFGAALLMNLI